uniref:Odorant-binding protein OBP41 n=1 Tax=Lobesia botrana TaxID=209534 RepID=A0A345BER4_9NEOP|nr:odorant-binding protein OBP41 [Lobesia botrana]
MLRFMILGILLTTAWADLDDLGKKCKRLGHPSSMLCCKSEMPKPNLDPEEMKECMEIPHVPHSCEHEICIGKKRGYITSDDGTIDMEVLEKVLEEDFKNYPTLVAALQINCIKGGFEKFGPPDTCQLIKIKRCFHYQLIQDCTEWDDSGSCAGIKDVVKECVL